MTTSTLPSSNPTCLYCGSVGPFSDEHVISAGLGADDNRFLLTDCVCATCNTERLSPIELEMLRSSPVAISRLFMQPYGRDRGKRKSAPKLQTKSKVVNLEGGSSEFEFIESTQPCLLAQLTLRGEDQFDVSAPSREILNDFLVRVESIFSDPVTCIRKHRVAGKPVLDAYHFDWEDDSALIHQGSVKKAQSEDIWLEEFGDSLAPDACVRARLMQLQGGNIVLRTSEGVSQTQALIILRRALGQIDLSSAKESIVTTPSATIQMSMLSGATERVLAKTGLNILAFVAGSDYVRQACFDAVKQSILTGEPEIPPAFDGVPDSMSGIFECVPGGMHVFCIAEGPTPDGVNSIGMSAKLYGTSGYFVPLAFDAPTRPGIFPIIFTVDYKNHHVEHLTPIKFAKFLIEHIRSD